MHFFQKVKTQIPKHEIIRNLQQYVPPCPELCPGGFWVSLRWEDSTTSLGSLSVLSHSHNKDTLPKVQIEPLVCAHCLLCCHWAPLERVSLHPPPSGRYIGESPIGSLPIGEPHWYIGESPLLSCRPNSQLVLKFWSILRISRIEYKWKIKIASFKKKIKCQVQTIICCILARQLSFTINIHFITAAIKVKLSIFKRSFHGFTREPSSILSSASQTFWQLWCAFWSTWNRQHLQLEIYLSDF